MSIESFNFAAFVFGWCLKNGITDHEIITELIDAIAQHQESLTPNPRAPRIFSGKNGPIPENKFRELRLAKGMAQQALAEKIGIASGVLSRIENGIIFQGRPFEKVKRYWEHAK